MTVINLQQKQTHHGQMTSTRERVGGVKPGVEWVVGIEGEATLCEIMCGGDRGRGGGDALGYDARCPVPG